MVCVGVLGGFTLITVLLSGSQCLTLDQNNLVPVIKFLRHNYQPGPNIQYAIAFNAPATRCAGYIDDSFLETHDPQTVRNTLTNGNVYKNDRLIAAKPKKISNRKTLHSEYLLLRDPDIPHSPMTDLLNKEKEGCVVFYTFNSACTKTCINKDETDNILGAFDLLKQHQGPKAFVFTQVWRNDQDKDITTDLKAALGDVPLYKCTDTECVVQ